MTKLKRIVGILLVLATILALLPLSALAKAGDRLTGDEKLAYTKLVPIIQQIAAGERTSTVVTIGTAISGYPVDVEATFTGKSDDFDLDAILSALTSDHPYDMYWYGYSSRLNMRKYSDGTLVQATFSFTVAANYQGSGQYTVSAAGSAAAEKADAAAQAVVAANAHKSDYEKLVAYRDYICAAVTYDHDAADSNSFSSNSNPWQLVHVFDGNTSTNVVCEGYSKAFKHLCDLSEFDDPTFDCLTVTGWMSGGTGAGGHMWNIVTLGGKNYMVDVTNTDSGTIGEGGELFLTGSANKITADFDVTYSDGSKGTITRYGYRFLCAGSTNMDFYYDEDTVATWDAKALALAETDFTPNQSDPDVKPVTLATPAVTKLENVSNGIMITWGAVSGAERYRVFVKTASGWQAAGNTTGTSFTYTGAKSGKSYTFTVRCIDANGKFTSGYNATGWSQKYIVQPGVTKLENVSNGIKITWGAVSGAERYRVFVKTGSGWQSVGSTTGTSFTYTGAKSGQTYTFTVRCVDGADKKFTSAYNSAGWKQKYVAQPKVAKLENVSNGIKITWGAVSGAERYRVFVKTGSGWQSVGSTTGTSFTYTGAKSGQTYTFTVRCVDGADKKFTSAYNSAGWKQKYVAQPKVTKLENVSNGIKITWGAVSGAERYRVFVKTGSGWQVVGNTTGTSFTYTGAKSGQTYTFTVRCIDAKGSFTSSYNTTGWSQKYIAQPKVTKLENTSSGIRLTWNAVSGAERYRVFVKTSSGWQSIGSTTGTSFTYTGAKKGKTYTFTVRCVNGADKVFTSSYNTAGWQAKRT